MKIADRNASVDVLPSFRYDGVPADLTQWTETVSQPTREDGFTRVVREFRAPDGGLTLRLTEKTYTDFPAVEYLPELIGGANGKSAIVSDFMALDFSTALEWAECTVRAVIGSKNQPTDFSAAKFVLSNGFDHNRLTLTEEEGRSSDSWMPYIGIDFDCDNGLELAIGWSSNWKAEFRIERERLNCAVGMRKTNFFLYPGETLRQSAILVFSRINTSVAAFQSLIHDFTVRFKSPHDSRGKLLIPRLPVTASGGNRPPEIMHRIIEYAKRNQLPFDTFWVDAGWFGPPHMPDTKVNCGSDWWKYVGHWFVNTTIHTDGTLRGVSDAARAAGMKFLLWFEPERVAMDAPIRKEHPEYTLHAKGGKPDDSCYLLDMGNPGARQWIFETVCRLIDENGVDIYRQDFNMNPVDAWRDNEEPDRVGVRESRHIAGLYEYLDALRKRYPDMLMENCAAGGRRLDFEMTSRAHSYCRSDYFICRNSPAMRKYQFLMGQNAILNTLAYVPFQAGEANPVRAFQDYEMLSLAATGVVFTPPDWEGGLVDREFSAEETEWFRKVFGAVDRIRHILTGSFRPLTEPASLDESRNVAYQGWNAERNEGFAMFFRRRLSIETTMTCRLDGIEDGAEYEYEEYSGGRGRVSGAEFREQTVVLDQPESVRLVFYHKL